jgi:type IV pilus assembly protein PilY1
VGSAENGQTLYDLQLSSTITPGLSKTVAEYDLGTSYSQVITGSPAITWNSNGQAYAAWSENHGTSSWDVFLLNVSTGAAVQVLSPSSLTSMPIFGDSGNLYVGAGDNILEISASNLSSLESQAQAQASPPTESAGNYWSTLSSGSSSSTSTNMMPFSGNASTNIQWLQESYNQGSYWLTAESTSGISAIQQNGSGWTVQWISATTGAARNGSSGLVAQSSSDTSTNAIPVLPSNAVITDAALVAGGGVYLPVSVPPSGNTCGLSTAYYYLFKLNTGAFPSGLITTLAGTAVTGPLDVGYGNALTPSISFMNGRPILQSSSSNTNSSQVFPATTNAGLPLGGPAAWRLVLQH